MTEEDPRIANWRRARQGATEALAPSRQRVIASQAHQIRRLKDQCAALQARLDQRQADVTAPLRQLRIDIGAGLPHKALLERIDDLLWRFK